MYVYYYRVSFLFQRPQRLQVQKKVKKDENASYFGECVFDVHLNENFRNVRESFLWSFDWENVSFFL